MRKPIDHYDDFVFWKESFLCALSAPVLNSEPTASSDKQLVRGRITQTASQRVIEAVAIADLALEQLRDRLQEYKENYTLKINREDAAKHNEQ